MKRRLALARVLVTIPAIFLAVLPPLVDLNETHVFNPLWVGHARLHTVWLIASNSILSLMALWILWRRFESAIRESILLAGGVVGAILLGFFVAAATQSVYGGTLTDPNGVAITFGSMEVNLVAFSILFSLLISAAVLVRKPAA